MRLRRSAALGTAVVLLVSSGGSAVQAVRAAPPPPCPAPGDGPRPGGPASPYDLTGDGYDDLVISGLTKRRPGGPWFHFDSAGYGSPRGLDPAKGTSLVRCVSGLTAVSDDHDNGAQGAYPTPGLRGDLDHDGYADLVLRLDRDQRIVWGGRQGPYASTPVPVRPVKAVADFDGDGALDLLALDSTSRILYGPISRTGAAARSAELDASQGGWVPPAEAVAGDFDGDGRGDLVVFGSYAEEDARFEDEDAPDVESAEVFRGTRAGLRKVGPVEPLNISYTGLGLRPLPGASGDVNGDRYDDLIVPRDILAGGRSAGGLTIVYGGPRGLGRTTTYIDQDTPGVPGTGESGDRFGWGLAVGDVNGDGRDDVAAPATGENRQAGSVTLLLGGPYGLTAAGARRFDLDTPGMPGEPNRAHGGDLFGSNTQLLDLDRDGHADLVTGAPAYWPGKYRTGGFRRPGFWRDGEVGGYWILRGTQGGLSTDGVRFFSVRSLR